MSLFDEDSLPPRQRIIAQMLRRYNEAQDPASHSGMLGSGDSVALMPPTWNRSYRELERVLAAMRVERKSQWWHLTERYIRAQEALVECRVVRKRGQAVIKLPPHCELAAGAPIVGERVVKARVRRWVPEVDNGKVRKGLEWVADCFRGEPFLPVEFTETAREAA